VALPAMAGIHALIGVGEAIITTTAVSLILRTRPDLVISYSGKGAVYEKGA
jgi:cobalt/nickel transport system permease protein